jgi:chorismate mutase
MHEIQKLRKRIDVIDDQILMALCERIKVCKAIGTAKKKQSMPIKDTFRESKVLKRINEKSTQLGLDSVHVEAVYREIVNMCIVVQE